MLDDQFETQPWIIDKKVLLWAGDLYEQEFPNLFLEIRGEGSICRNFEKDDMYGSKGKN
jgi:hypothetical protein